MYITCSTISKQETAIYGIPGGIAPVYVNITDAEMINAAAQLTRLGFEDDFGHVQQQQQQQHSLDNCR